MFNFVLAIPAKTTVTTLELNETGGLERSDLMHGHSSISHKIESRLYSGDTPNFLFPDGDKRSLRVPTAESSPEADGGDRE